VFAAVPAGAQQSSEPSLKYKIVELNGGFGGLVSHSQTVYIGGVNERQEMPWPGRDGSESPHATIWNRDLHRKFELDLAAKVYTVTKVDENGLPLDRPHTHAKWEPSGRTQRIHIETIDTGKRRTMFGYTARRVITRETSVTNPPGDSSERIFETDGWYIDPPLWPRLAPAVHGISARDADTMRKSDDGNWIWQKDDVRVTYQGPRETGLPLALRARSQSGQKSTGFYHYERVIDVSERPVDPALFLPPPDFKRLQPTGPPVAVVRGAYQYPFSLRVRLNWLILADYGL